MLIGLDADNTLWPGDPGGRTQVVLDQFVEMVADPDIGSRHTVNVDVFGSGALSLFWTMAESALRAGVNRDIALDAMRIAADFCREMHEAPVKPFEGAVDALTALKAAGHKLVLITQGSPAEQISKLRRSGLSGLIDGVAHLAWKSEAAYRALITGACEGDGSEFVMVGDSLQDDVAAAHAAGARVAVLIDPDGIHAATDSYRVAESVADLPALLLAPPPVAAGTETEAKGDADVAQAVKPEAAKSDDSPPDDSPPDDSPPAATDASDAVHPALEPPKLNTASSVHQGTWHMFPDRGFGVRVDGVHPIHAVLTVDVTRQDGTVLSKIVNIIESHAKKGHSIGLVVGDDGKAAPVYVQGN